MTLLLLLLLATPFDEALAKADALAKAARAVPDEKPAEKARQVDAALAAYAAALRLKEKDPKLAPRVRRRRASLLKHAGRPRDALKEYDAIVIGRARRKDKARALYDGARLLERAGDARAAEARLRRAIDEFGDDIRTRALASLALGRLCRAQNRLREAERAFRHVVERCRDQAKACVEAYDELALLELARGRRPRARAWLRACMRRFEKRAARDDRYGRFVGRLLADMKAPRALAR
jgi:tetratricopeptide (TPR) repeat protein